jgi:outer membrane protein OmpA-like peptidoglycan-associated protein
MQNAPRASVLFASRGVLRAVSTLLVATSVTGCVAAKNYDEARSVAESEAAAHARTRERLEASMQRINALEAELAERERVATADENAAAASKLESTVASKEKEAAAALVDELRSELARTGDNLLLFAREKHDLTQTLLVAEQRMGDIDLAGKHLSELVLVTRDLSLGLGSELEQGTVELGARDGSVVLGVKPEVLFTASSDSLTTTAVPVLLAVGKVSAAHPTLRVIVREPLGMSASARLEHLGDALRERGVADSRLVLPSGGSEQPAAPAVDATATAGASPSATTNPPNPPNASAGMKTDAPAAPPPETGPSVYEIAFAP